MKILGLMICIPLFLFADYEQEIGNVQKEGKHACVLFYKCEDQRLYEMEEKVQGFSADHLSECQFLKYKISDPDCLSLIKKYDLKRTPMPFLLVIAPNDAVTGGFPLNIDTEKLESSLLSLASQEMMKGMQQKKLVFLVFQNENTKYSSEALEGVDQLLQDPRFKEAGVVIKVDPKNVKEKELLKQFDLNASMEQTITILLAPPADFVTKIEGASSKKNWMDALEKASKPCCPGGCCPGGCCG